MKTNQGAELHLKLWQKVLVAPLLVLLILGVGCISAFFAGGGSVTGFVVGLVFLAVGSFTLMEFGRLGGAPQTSKSAAVAHSVVILALGLIALVLIGSTR